MKIGNLVKCIANKLHVAPIGSLWTDGILSMVFLGTSHYPKGSAEFDYDVVFICFETGEFGIHHVHKLQLTHV